ncbi:MAG: PAS domain S-box protein, partial [Bacteroidetes bacterium]
AFVGLTEGKEQQYASYENQVLSRSGKRIVISWQHATIHDGDGTFMGVLSTGNDITAWKEKEAEIQQLNQELEQKVKQRTQELERSENLLRQAQRIAHIGSWEFDFIHDHVIWSEELYRMMGIDPALPAPQFNGQESLFPPEDWAQLTENVGEAIREGRPYALDLRIIRPDSSIRHIQAQGHPGMDAEGRVVKLTGTVQDITDRKNIETRLEKSRQELEAFSYSVSHDLRTPLRGIDGWSVALTEDFSDILPPQALQYLSRIRTETQRMGQLIDDLLTLARISRHEMKVSVVDLSAIAQRIAQRLSESAPGRNIDFVVQPGLTARGDAGLLGIMLTNLLENAFKFTSRQAHARIELSQTTQNGVRVYAVRDNGVGFNMEYAKKLFAPFQRMHRQSEFPGTGVGLATVQRVVHLHMGTIWASSAVGEGATFYFTINP